MTGFCGVTVCIITHKRDEKLIERVGKLYRFPLRPAQVLIVDNGRSAELLEHLEDVPLSIEQI